MQEIVESGQFKPSLFLWPALMPRVCRRYDPPKRPAVFSCSYVPRAKALRCNPLVSFWQREALAHSGLAMYWQTCSPRETGTSFLESKQKTKIYFEVFPLRGVVECVLLRGLPRGTSENRVRRKEIH
jgi:hypothetical protein